MNVTEQELRRSDEYRAAGYWGDDTFVTLIDKWADADPNHPYVSDGSPVSYTHLPSPRD